MQFDTIIIGGGLTGLLCALRLQEKGQKCAIVSSGQSAMHFWSGSFDVLNHLSDGAEVDSPFEAMKSLPSEHPYSIIGAERVRGYLDEAVRLLESVGCHLDVPEDGKNRWRVSSMGSIKKCYITLKDLLLAPSPEGKICEKALVASLDGFLDFNSEFISKAIEDSGSPCRAVTIHLEALSKLRKSPTEMRATNISRVLDRPTFKEYISQIKEKYDGEDLIILPAIFSLKDAVDAAQIGKVMNTTVRFVPTLPPSVPGIEVQRALTDLFCSKGGTLLKGDTVTSGAFEGGKLTAIRTANIPDLEFTADNFVLASGSFFSKGLTAQRNSFFETALGVDVEGAEDRKEWFDANDFFAKQNYIGYGVKTTEGAGLKASKDGAVIENLYAAGAILGGCNALFEGCGGGVAVSSAYYAADSILA